MSLRLEMLQVARLAPKILGESTELIRSFLSSQQNADGGFRDRAGRSDLYYTVFGLDALESIQADPHVESIATYVRSQESGQDLDFVHLCCLARCWAGLSGTQTGTPIACPFPQEILEKIEHFRSADGGYHPKQASDHGTAYAAFLALGAYSDLGQMPPEPLQIARSLKCLETGDGAWLNERVPAISGGELRARVGSTNATAAAVILLRYLDLPIHDSVAVWLMARAHPQGGFLANPLAPVPDLLSTATALHALSSMQYDFEKVKEPCLDFIDTLWTNAGAFHGNWTDESLDCEYTFYGLLALGHLSL